MKSSWYRIGSPVYWVNTNTCFPNYRIDVLNILNRVVTDGHTSISLALSSLNMIGLQRIIRSYLIAQHIGCS